MDELIFDIEILMTSADGDRLWAEELFDIFINDTQDRMEKMGSLLESRDRTEIRRHIHTIKGAAGSIGALTVKRSAYEMELLAVSGDYEGFRSKMIMLKNELDMLRSAFETEFRKGSK
ncbi:MAG TPA: Hpt domain-containing protein [bacterium]|nr:Hpt domain-containing protein [bacterium]